METKIVKIYKCPVCGKEYKRKGHYLSLHLKKCNAIAWIPKVKYEIVMNLFEADKFNEAISNLASGNFTTSANPIERVKKSKVMTSEDIEKSRNMQELFKEFSENPPELVSVPEGELHHIYNVVIA